MLKAHRQARALPLAVAHSQGCVQVKLSGCKLAEILGVHVGSQAFVQSANICLLVGRIRLLKGKCFLYVFNWFILFWHTDIDFMASCQIVLVPNQQAEQQELLVPSPAPWWSSRPAAIRGFAQALFGYCQPGYR